MTMMANATHATQKLLASMPNQTMKMPVVMVAAITVTPAHLPKRPKKGPESSGTTVLAML